MIDRTARLAAADLLERFLRGSATNDELEDGWPTSGSDSALSQIEFHIWGTYDDMSEYRLEPSTLPEETKALYSRTVLFLRTNLEYEWPELPAFRLGATVLAFATLGLSRVLSIRKRARFRASGDLGVWPFLRRSDFEEAARLQPVQAE